MSAVAPSAPSILFVGDVVGGLGRRTLLALLPRLRAEHRPTFVVVNGENAAGGLGITPKIADELFAAGVDVITLGTTVLTGASSTQDGLVLPHPRAHEREFVLAPWLDLDPEAELPGPDGGRVADLLARLRGPA